MHFENKFGHRIFLRLAIITSMVSLAHAQTPYACTSVEADTPFLRSDGKTEMAGDIRISCLGNTLSSIKETLLDVVVQFDAPVTNRILNSATNASDALLFVGEPTSPILGKTLFQGIPTAAISTTLSAITFKNVPFFNSATPVIYRISNVRVNVTGRGTTVAPRAPAVQAFIGICCSDQMATNIPNRNPLVGFVVASQTMQLQTPAGVNIPFISLAATGGENAALATSTTAAGATVNNLIRFDEGFPSAIRRRNKATTFSNPSTLADQADLGANYGTETGYYNSALPSSVNLAGLATQGSRLIARFTNIPAGVAIFASISQTAGSASSAKARLIAVDSQGSGLFSATPQTTTASLGSASVGIAPLIVAGGTATAVWEVTDADPATVESLVFGIVTAYSSDSTSVISATGKLGPQSGSDSFDATSEVPRFGTAATPSTTGCTINCLNVPEAISFIYKGGPSPEAIALPVTSSGGPVSFSASVTTAGVFEIAPPNGNWLTLSSASGITPSTLSVSVNPAGLAPGQYPAFVTIAKSDGTGPAKRVFVLLTVLGSSKATFLCTANAGVPPLLRNFGLTEPLGDYVLNCAIPPYVSSTFTADLQLTLYASLTSRINGKTSDVLLLINDPPSGSLTSTGSTYRGEQISRNRLVFRNVSLPVSTVNTSNVSLRFVNLAADISLASALNGSPSTVYASVASPFLSISGSEQGLGFIQPGMLFALRDASNNPVSNLVFSGPPVTGPNGAAVSNILSFREGFFSAFKKRNSGTSASTPFALLNQEIAGNLYYSETGFYFSGFPAVSGLNIAGLATQGTRLMVRFNNIPSAVSLYVTTDPLPSKSPTIRARLTQTEDTGAGSYNAVAPAATGIFGTTNAGLAPVTLSGGSGIAVWEFFGDESSQFSTEELQFGVVAVYNTPQVGTATVTGMLGPLSSVNTADTTAPMPRFAATLPALPKCIDLTCLTVPASITLNSTDGKPASTTFSIIDNGQPTPFTVKTTGESWLRVSPFGGSSPGTMTITADPSTVSGGTYTGSVTLTTDTPGLYTIPVTFNVAGPVIVPPPPVRRLPVPGNQ